MTRESLVLYKSFIPNIIQCNETIHYSLASIVHSLNCEVRYEVCGLLRALFYIERDPRSRTEIGERDTQLVHVNEATAA
jgi:hypothetical protein